MFKNTEETVLLKNLNFYFLAQIRPSTVDEQKHNLAND